MTRTATFIWATGLLGGAFLLVAAQQPTIFDQVQPGIWEISGAPGLKAPTRQCVSDLVALARYEHRTHACSSKVVRESASSADVDYSCGGAGFGHSEVALLTPRSLRINTQGISGGLPFNYTLQARRVDDCPKSASFAHH